MKTITLGTLISKPLKVKRLTRAGQSITVIDHGNPLCVIRPAPEKEFAGIKARCNAIDKIVVMG